MIYLSGVATLNDDVRQNMINERKSSVESEISKHYADMSTRLEASLIEEAPEPDIVHKMQKLSDPKYFQGLFE